MRVETEREEDVRPRLVQRLGAAPLAPPSPHANGAQAGGLEEAKLVLAKLAGLVGLAGFVDEADSRARRVKTTGADAHAGGAERCPEKSATEPRERDVRPQEEDRRLAFVRDVRPDVQVREARKRKRAEAPAHETKAYDRDDVLAADGRGLDRGVHRAGDRLSIGLPARDDEIRCGERQAHRGEL